MSVKSFETRGARLLRLASLSLNRDDDERALRLVDAAATYLGVPLAVRITPEGRSVSTLELHRPSRTKT